MHRTNEQHEHNPIAQMYRRPDAEYHCLAAHGPVPL